MASSNESNNSTIPYDRFSDETIINNDDDDDGGNSTGTVYSNEKEIEWTKGPDPSTPRCCGGFCNGENERQSSSSCCDWCLQDCWSGFGECLGECFFGIILGIVTGLCA